MTDKVTPRKSNVDRIERINLSVCAKGAWGALHFRAWNRSVDDYTKGFQTEGPRCPVGPLIIGWARYGDHHYKQFESQIGDDGVLGPAWAGIGEHIRTLLNGELNGLDGGTLDRIIYEILEAEGCQPYGE